METSDAKDGGQDPKGPTDSRQPPEQTVYFINPEHMVFEIPPFDDVEIEFLDSRPNDEADLKAAMYLPASFVGPRNTHAKIEDYDDE